MAGIDKPKTRSLKDRRDSAVETTAKELMEEFKTIGTPILNKKGKAVRWEKTPEALEEFRKKLLKSGDEILKAIHQKANKVAGGKSPMTRKDIWLFLHPSPKVMQACLTDDNLFKGLSQLGIVFEQSMLDEKGRIGYPRRDILREAVAPDISPVVKTGLPTWGWEFLEHYSYLVRSVHQNDWSHFIAHNNNFEFLPIPNWNDTKVRDEFMETAKARAFMTHMTQYLKEVAEREKSPHKDLYNLVAGELEKPSPDSFQKFGNRLIVLSAFNIKPRWDEPTPYKLASESERIPLFAYSQWLPGNFVDKPFPTYSTSKDSAPFRFFDADIEFSFGEQNKVSLEEFTSIKNGLLPIGIKVHGIRATSEHATPLTGAFKAHGAEVSYNLPPVGSIDALKKLDEILTERMGSSFFDNKDYQIQVCMPGVLSAENAAILGSVAFLAGTKLRYITKESLVTSHDDSTGRRTVIYGAGNVNHNFEFWGRDGDSNLHVVEDLRRVASNRTDVLLCRSISDIENVQLVSTLLLHLQIGKNAFWGELGTRFVRDYYALLDKYQLKQAVDNEHWVVHRNLDTGTGLGARRLNSPVDDFLSCLAELYTEAQAEAKNFEKTGKKEGLIFELQDLLQHYKLEIQQRSEEALKKKS